MKRWWCVRPMIKAGANVGPKTNKMFNWLWNVQHVRVDKTITGYHFSNVFNYDILPKCVWCNKSRSSKVFERWGSPSSFSSGFYKFPTKCIKPIAQKKQIAKILENLGKFWALLLKKQEFQIKKKIGVMMLIITTIFGVTGQKSMDWR